MANTTFPTIDINKAAADFNNVLKEGAYIAVGLGVLGFQRAQVRRVELAKQLDAQRQQVASQLGTYSEMARAQSDVARTQLTEQVATLSKNLEETVGPAVARLARMAQSEQLKESTQAIEEGLGTARTQLAELAKALDEWLQPIRQQLDEQLDRLEERLPAGAREGVHSVRAASVAQEQAWRSAIGLD